MLLSLLLRIWVNAREGCFDNNCTSSVVVISHQKLILVIILTGQEICTGKKLKERSLASSLSPASTPNIFLSWRDVTTQMINLIRFQPFCPKSGGMIQLLWCARFVNIIQNIKSSTCIIFFSLAVHALDVVSCKWYAVLYHQSYYYIASIQVCTMQWVNIEVPTHANDAYPSHELVPIFCFQGQWMSTFDNLRSIIFDIGTCIISLVFVNNVKQVAVFRSLIASFTLLHVFYCIYCAQ